MIKRENMILGPPSHTPLASGRLPEQFPESFSEHSQVTKEAPEKYFATNGKLCSDDFERFEESTAEKVLSPGQNKAGSSVSTVRFDFSFEPAPRATVSSELAPLATEIPKCILCGTHHYGICMQSGALARLEPPSAQRAAEWATHERKIPLCKRCGANHYGMCCISASGPKASNNFVAVLAQDNFETPELATQEFQNDNLQLHSKLVNT